MKNDAPVNDKTSIQVIERMVSLLDALSRYQDPVSLKELASVTGLHPSTTHRILNDLVITRFRRLLTMLPSSSKRMPSR